MDVPVLIKVLITVETEATGISYTVPRTVKEFTCELRKVSVVKVVVRN